MRRFCRKQYDTPAAGTISYVMYCVRYGVVVIFTVNPLLQVHRLLIIGTATCCVSGPVPSAVWFRVDVVASFCFSSPRAAAANVSSLHDLECTMPHVKCLLADRTIQQGKYVNLYDSAHWNARSLTRPVHSRDGCCTSCRAILREACQLG